MAGGVVRYPPSLIHMFSHTIPSDRYGIIYVITHIESGKQYVGQTIHTLSKRWKGHIQKAKKPGKFVSLISRYIGKYGPNDFTIETLDYALSKDVLDYKECFWIAFLDTMSESGLNLKDGGSAGVMCQESLQQMANKLRGRKAPEGHPFTIKGNKWAKGSVRTPEQRKAHGERIKKGFEEGVYKGNTGKVFQGARKPVQCIETGIIYPSRSEAAKAMLDASGRASEWNWGSAKHIGSAIKNGWKAFGVHWKEANPSDI